MPPKLRHSNVILGDCVCVMKTLPNNHFDTIITDPSYGLGISKKKWTYDLPDAKMWAECLRVLKPGGTMLCFSGARTQHRVVCAIEDAGFIIKDCIMWIYGSGFCKALDISKQLDKKAGKKRKIIGVAGKSGSKRNSMKSDFKGGEYFTTKPNTELAKLWEGWKSHGLKPAYEPICMAIKPNNINYANNAIKHGVSGLNIKDCKIKVGKQPGRKSSGGFNSGGNSNCYGDSKGVSDSEYTDGRFPANIILDEEAGRMLDKQSGIRKKRGNPKRNSDVNRTVPDDFFVGKKRDYSGSNSLADFADGGGASRFFYCAKASRSEKNAGCELLQKKIAGSMIGNVGETMDLGGASLKGKHKQIQPKLNFHPTVKPLKLMEYLCKLTSTPTGGLVLDPCAGSGTTGVACVNIGREFVLIEKDIEYIPIINARIKHAKKILNAAKT